MSILAFLLPLSLLAGTKSLDFLPVPVYAVHVVMLGIIASCLLQFGLSHYRGSFKKIPAKLQLALILMLVGLVTGVMRAEGTKEAISALVTWAILPAATVFLLLFQPSETKAKQAERGLLAGGLIFGLVQTGIGFMSFFQGAYDEPRLAGTFASPNAYAAVVAPLLAILLLRIVTKPRALHIAAAITFLSGIILSKSLGGMLAVAAASLCILFVHANKKLRKILLATVLVLVAVGVLIAQERFTGREGNSFASRMQIWSTASSLIADNPMSGVGLRGFRSAYEERVVELYPQPFQVIEREVPEPHNLYLAWWLNAGLFGLLGLLLFTSLVLSKKGFQVVVFPALVAILAHGLIDTPFFLLELAILWWVYFGIFAKHYKLAD
jgi:O-antigen ligase